MKLIRRLKNLWTVSGIESIEKSSGTWHFFGKPKGHIIYPKSEEQADMEELFERNDRKGEDTPIGEIESDEQMP